MTTTDTQRPVHEGRNLKRIREMLQVKQATLAQALGGDWNQKKISQLEDKEAIDPQILDEVAKALKVSPEAIKNFDEEAANHYINTFNDSSVNNGAVGCSNYNCSFNPIDKVVELYERMLKDKNEMIESLKELVNKK